MHDGLLKREKRIRGEDNESMVSTRTPASAAELEVAEKELTATQTQEISASTDGMFQNL